MRATETRETRQTRSWGERFETRDYDGQKRIEGYFAVFGEDYELWPGASESVDPGAFDGQLDGDVRCLINHDTTLVLGRTTAGTLELRTDSHGLWGSVVINQDDQEAMNLYARVQRGDVSQCSFGFDILDEAEEIRQDGTVHWTIKQVKLYEVSCCTFPAYKGTGISARAARAATIRERERAAKIAELKERVKNAW